MKIVNRYYNFYLDDILYHTKEKIDVSNNINQSFPSSFIIKINENNHFIDFDLEGNYFETKVKGLNWRFFSNDFLLKMNDFLNVNIRKAINIENENNLIIFYNEKTLSTAIRKYRDKEYMIVYYLDLPDLYRGAGLFKGELYIHEIFEIKR